MKARRILKNLGTRRHKLAELWGFKLISWRMLANLAAIRKSFRVASSPVFLEKIHSNFSIFLINKAKNVISEPRSTEDLKDENKRLRDKLENLQLTVQVCSKKL